MKKIYLLVAVFAYFSISSYAQSPHAAQLYGMTQYGGSDHMGTIFHYTPETHAIQVDYEFKVVIKGSTPKGDIVSAGNGKYYGTTTAGGANNAGVIFEWDSATYAYKELYNFTGDDGSDARGTMVLYNSKFYGMTNAGGTNNAGVIYEWDFTKNIYTKKIDMEATNGKNPDGSLSLIGNKFYGFTHNGGASDKGVLFDWDPATNIYTKRYDFDSLTGSNPVGKLSEYNGKLYAMTNLGGAKNQGVIYEWDYTKNLYTKKFDFDSIRGQHPLGYLTLFNNKFYGMTYEGGIYETSFESDHYGVLFEWNPATNAFVKKRDLGGTQPATRTGYGPLGSLTIKDNNLWGITTQGFTGYGYIFSYDPVTNIWIDRFSNTGGSFPDHYKNESYFQAPGSMSYGAMLLSGNNFIAASSATAGGLAGCIFKYSVDSNWITKAVHMQTADGAYPKGSFTRLGNKLYGLTYLGGKEHFGNIFEWDLDTHQFKERFAFDGNKTGGITPGSLSYYNGKFYGWRNFTTSLSNPANTFANWVGQRQGSYIFSWDPATNVFSSNSKDQPTVPQPAPLTLQNGKFYTTGYTGYNGSIVQYDPATDVVKDTALFNGANGDFAIYQDYSEQCGLTYYNGKFYGMTPSRWSAATSSNIKGGIYEWDPVTNIITGKVAFDDTTGFLPMGDLTLVGNVFYGVTSSQPYNFGSLFKWDPATNVFEKKVEMGAMYGTYVMHPQGTLTYSGGKLYGLGYGIDLRQSLYNSSGNPGGALTFPGTVFEFDPVKDTITSVETFNYYGGLTNSGVNPAFTKLLEVIPNQVPLLSNTPTAQTTCSNRMDSVSFTITDADNDTMHFQIQSSNTTVLPVQNISITNVGTAYKLSYTSAGNQFGNVTITVTANDGYGGSVKLSFPVTIIASTQSPCNALPVTLLSFAAQANAGTSFLTWQTTAEYNTKGFEIERSFDGVSFTKIAFVEAINSAAGNVYSYTDYAPENGYNHYRLKLIEANGSFAYSTVKSLEFTAIKNITVYPNPVADFLYVSVKGQNKYASIMLTDVAGRKLFTTSDCNGQFIKIPMANRQTGVYLLTLFDGAYTTTKKIVKQ